MSILAIFENLVADVAFLILAVLIGWIWVRVTRRRTLQRFFGASTSKRLVVYLSNIRVLPFGAAGISGERMSYQGTAVPNGEVQAANSIRDLHSFLVPSIAEPRGVLRRVLFADVLVQIIVSPLDDEELESGAPFISLGSPAYNVASEYIESNSPKSARFRPGILREEDLRPPSRPGPTVALSTDAGEYISPSGTAWYAPGAEAAQVPRGRSEVVNRPPAIIVDDVPPITDPTYAFVQRSNDQASDRMMFYVAGLSEHSTAGAANYLADEWANLNKKYSHDKSFLVMLRFDENDPRRWTIVFERDLGV